MQAKCAKSLIEREQIKIFKILLSSDHNNNNRIKKTKKN